jgi:hypothetical protein
MLATERREFMAPSSEPWTLRYEPLPDSFPAMPWDRVEKEFLEEFSVIQSKRDVSK